MSLQDKVKVLKIHLQKNAKQLHFNIQG